MSITTASQSPCSTADPGSTTAAYRWQSRHMRALSGRRGIRTPERVTPLAVFKTAAFVRSAILPASIVAGQTGDAAQPSPLHMLGWRQSWQHSVPSSAHSPAPIGHRRILARRSVRRFEDSAASMDETPDGLGGRRGAPAQRLALQSFGRRATPNERGARPKVRCAVWSFPSDHSDRYSHAS
jgi:hypothetical protein